MATSAQRNDSQTVSGFHALQRALADLLGREEGLDSAGLLEVGVMAAEPPRLISAEVLEPGEMQAHPISGRVEPAFAAFLDGTQASRVVRYVDGYAIVHGTVAAVIRARRERRMLTWRHPVVRSRLYVPRAVLPARTRKALDSLPMEIVDTTAPEHGDASVGSHPFAIRDAAVHVVQKDREAAERELAELWCSAEHEPLLIDGGISGSERVAVSRHTVGVVKSHRTLYAEGDALQVVFRLGAGERSSAFRVTSPKRTTVASWYLRLRDARGHDPLWGLVRVEIAMPPRGSERDVARLAGEVSRWVLAEVAPLSLPDSRWDKMVYPVYDCEQYLKSLV